MPTYSWLYSEFLQQKLMPQHHVVDHVLVVCACLIMHAPASIDELQPALSHELPHLLLPHVIPLLPPPHAEELHLNVCEPLVRIIKQLIHDSLYDTVHIGLRNILVAAGVVLIYSLEPPYIIVCVRDQMHCYISFSVFLTKCRDVVFEFLMLQGSGCFFELVR